MRDRAEPAALAARFGEDQRGFSIMEAVVATVIAIIAIVGLAHSFSVGRAMVDRYEVARAALGVAQRRMEILTTIPPAALPMGVDSTRVFSVRGVAMGTEWWRVDWVDARVDSLGGADLDANPNDLKRATVRVWWGTGVESDTIRFAREFPAS